MFFTAFTKSSNSVAMMALTPLRRTSGTEPQGRAITGVPQASAFYRATAATPLGTRARRHLTTQGRKVVRIEDEIFDSSLLTDDTVKEMLGAQSVVRPYSGAVCQYVLARQSSLVDVVFSWFDSGSSARERAVATERGAQITDVEVERHPAFLAKSGGDVAACSATTAAGSGVVTWWVQYRPQGGDPCQAAQKLLAATLSSDM